MNVMVEALLCIVVLFVLMVLHTIGEGGSE